MWYSLLLVFIPLIYIKYQLINEYPVNFLQILLFIVIRFKRGSTYMGNEMYSLLQY